MSGGGLSQNGIKPSTIEKQNVSLRKFILHFLVLYYINIIYIYITSGKMLLVSDISWLELRCLQGVSLQNSIGSMQVPDHIPNMSKTFQNIQALGSLENI